MLDDLLPTPHVVHGDESGARVPADRITLVVGHAPGSEAWRLLADEHPEALPPEGYILRVSGDESGGRAVIAAADEGGLFRGRGTLAQVRAEPAGVPALTIRDAPTLSRRGVVEGFYGPPWSHADRVEFLRFAGRVGFNEYVYAPKDDTYHRENWREPYPAALLGEIAELVAEAERNRVRFVYAISPALSMRFAERGEHEALAAKAQQLWSAGVRRFAVLFDDVPGELTHAADRERFGADARATGRAHGFAAAVFEEEFLRAHHVPDPLLICPTDYAGCAPSPYREGLRETLPEDALVLWTGSDIVVGEVTRRDIDEAAASYGRRLVLWDNFPVNDFDRSRLFLGPLLGRTTDLAGSALVGVASNPMVEAAPSHLALATVADWAWNPETYVPADSARRALGAVAGRHAAAVEALVAVSSSWPPSAPQSAHIGALAPAALGGDADALAGLEAALTLLARAGEDEQAPPSPLTNALRPWLAAARDAADAGARACALLRHMGEEHEQALVAEREALARAQERADAHYQNVLRSVLPDFVREVLVRAGMAGMSVPAHRHVAVLVGGNPVPGDRDLSERLTARGFDVDLVAPGGAVREDTDLIIVSPNAGAADARAVTDAAVPLLAWGRFDTLGLSSRSGEVLGQEDIAVIDDAHPLAAGASGTVRVYRGPGMVSWGRVGPHAEIVATTSTNGLPVIARYPAGSTLASGRRAPADRVLFFLGTDGLAPWLIAPEGHELFTAAVNLLCGELAITGARHTEA
ncbi:Glycosyl hydrolase family 20, domain 2 [Paramicrobacterium humi]|uniref:Glycosyl hydrolase family 20, domain 2 n=1 Tax=Paramicrobacterium humi TaxID=640635 RepID=A0A1H4KKF5_9MICO|nr:beta-N-acetylglucosaminidase domain-containing protein [Microbacterium humi]SEB58578.1 Glycosyl hydrolase family 20, domain 2 [Microbacterium humi]